MSHKVRAKFKCISVQEPTETNENKFVNLMAVTDGSEENKSFSKYTPNGTVQINISPETSAFDFFEAGEEYFLDFQKVPE